MNWYIDAMQKYATFTGRATRQAYWMFFLFNLIIAFVIGFIFGALAAVLGLGKSFVEVIIHFYWLLTLLPTIAIGVRRMHDIGRTGWWIIVPIVSFVFLLIDTEPQDNEYGPNPKAFTG